MDYLPPPFEFVPLKDDEPILINEVYKVLEGKISLEQAVQNSTASWEVE